MPVFINEVVFRAEVGRAPAERSGDEPAAARPAERQAERQALVDEVTQAVVDLLERELDRIGER